MNILRWLNKINIFSTLILLILFEFGLNNLLTKKIKNRFFSFENYSRFLLQIYK